MTRQDLKVLLSTSLLLLAIGAASTVSAYEAQVAVRAIRGAEDDGVMIQASGISLANGGIIWAPKIAGAPKVYMIDRSVGFCLQTTNPQLAPIARFTSLDVIHDTVPTVVADRCVTAPSQAGTTAYDFKLYMTRDLLWVEAKRSGALIAPTLSTVFFVSPIRDVEDLADVPGGVYFRSQDLKADIQTNYADRYMPTNVGFIEYAPEAIAAAVHLTTIHP
jgi:hypothetical protein